VVVASPTGVAGEITEAGGGILVEHGDADAIAQALETFARMSADEWQARSAAAQRVARGFDWDRSVDRFESILLEEAAAHAARRS
jgi:glycosyltransferase involved in cell wall biosynthesis